MPWKRKTMHPRRLRLIFIVLAVAFVGGILAVLAGGLLHVQGPILLDKYSPFKAMMKGYSEEQIRAVMRRRGH